ncbi:hypothetical protein E2C01_029715 [Portunus trituberculatus]|uniref:Uncharacterized protein n=1 Tax=Portunus trituberculatus TaxID=210409 RepID=A0A5B7ETM7_PORTR|nr:hypothetical protein [Portunus trituberculatus]
MASVYYSPKDLRICLSSRILWLPLISKKTYRPTHQHRTSPHLFLPLSSPHLSLHLPAYRAPLRPAFLHFANA